MGASILPCPAFCPLVALPTSTSRSRVASISRRPRVIHASTTSAPAPVHHPVVKSSTHHAPHQTNAGPSPTPLDVPPSPSPSPPPPSGRSPDFHANVGSVIDMLRDEYPLLLTECPSLDLFRDDMLFSDTSGNRLYGKDAYRTVLFLLRLHVRVILTNAALTVVSLQYRDDEPSIHVRWRLRAAPRTWALGATSEATVLDGLCVYYLDERGLIIHHAMETVIRGRRPMVRSLFERVLAVGQVTVRIPAGNICSDGPAGAILSATWDRVDWTPLPVADDADDDADQLGRTDVSGGQSLPTVASAAGVNAL